MLNSLETEFGKPHADRSKRDRQCLQAAVVEVRVRFRQIVSEQLNAEGTVLGDAEGPSPWAKRER
jgi:hypothetical protein